MHQVMRERNQRRKKHALEYHSQPSVHLIEIKRNYHPCWLPPICLAEKMMKKMKDASSANYAASTTDTHTLVKFETKGKSSRHRKTQVVKEEVERNVEEMKGEIKRSKMEVTAKPSLPRHPFSLSQSNQTHKPINQSSHGQVSSES